MKITVKEIKRNTANIEAVLTEAEVQAEKEHAVDDLINSVTVKGFRQGKAPKSIAAEHIDPDKLSNHILGHILSEIVSQVLQENRFKLLGRPVLDNIDSKNQQGWIIKLTLPLFPEVIIKDYQKLFSKKTKKEDIYQTLLDHFAVVLPQSVIEEEVNYSLEKLQNQAKTLNLSLEKYLQAVKKTLDQVKEEYAKKAEESIKLDLILLAIAQQEKIDTGIDEIKKVAETSGLPESQYGQLKNIIDRRKTIELLEKLC